MDPLLLLPGLLCDAWVWQAQIEGLRAVCDVRAWPDFYAHDSLDAMARAVLDAAPTRFHVCGHSMGGRVAFELYKLAPERIASLILLDTSTNGPQPHEPAARGALVELGRREGMAAVAAKWLPPMVHPRRRGDAEFMAALAAMVCRVSPEDFAREQHALLTRPDVTGLLPKIACPTLVGCGAEDEWSPFALHQEIAAAIPGAKLASISDSGHMVSVEQPAALTALLRDWIAARHG